MHVINGPHVKSQNTFDEPDQVGVRSARVDAGGRRLTLELEPHSVTTLVIDVA